MIARRSRIALPAGVGLAIVLTIVRVPDALAAQAWKQIGTTASGNAVFVNLRSVRKVGDLVSAVVRVVFTPPVKVANGTWASSHTTATFDCAKRTFAVKENAFYADARGTRLTERKVNKLPGYGTVIGGSPTAMALDYLCRPAR